MNKYETWCLKNKLLAFILHALAFCGIATPIFILLEAPIVVIVMLDLFLLFSAYSISCFSYAKAMKNAVAAFENCCPQAVYELTEQIKPYVKKAELQQIIINQTSALYCMGRHEEMLQILEDMNIDRYAELPLQYKIIYYNNLATAYELKGDAEKARAAFKKLRMLISDGGQKIKQQFFNQLVETEIFEAKMAGDYKKALELCLSRQNDKQIQRVDNAYTAAELYFAMGDIENARNQYSFVRVHGANTYMADVAGKKLEEIGD